MRFEVTQEFTFNPITMEVKIENTRITPLLNIANSSNFIYETGRVTNSTFTHNLVTFPANGALDFKQGEEIKVKYKNVITKVNITSVRGRLSGLIRIMDHSDFRKVFNVGDTIKMIYDPSSRLLELRK